MKKSQKGAWPQKLVLPTKAARACFRRFFAAHTPSPKHANQARPKPAHQARPKPAHQARPKPAHQASPKPVNPANQLLKQREKEFA